MSSERDPTDLVGVVQEMILRETGKRIDRVEAGEFLAEAIAQEAAEQVERAMQRSTRRTGFVLPRGPKGPTDVA